MVAKQPPTGQESDIFGWADLLTVLGTSQYQVKNLGSQDCLEVKSNMGLAWPLFIGLQRQPLSSHGNEIKALMGISLQQ